MSTSADRRVALLRGINVGKGPRIAMTDLRDCTAAAGCTGVKTVLATGNVIVTDARPAAELRAALENAYATRFGYDALVQIISRDDLETAAENYPFDTLDEHHAYLVFSDNPSVTELVVTTMSEVTETGGTEAVAAGPGCVYWRVSRGATLSSAAAKVLNARENRRHLTTRNLKTVHRILAAG